MFIFNSIIDCELFYKDTTMNLAFLFRFWKSFWENRKNT